MGTNVTAVERAWMECCELATSPAFDAAYRDFQAATAAENEAIAEWVRLNGEAADALAEFQAAERGTQAESLAFARLEDAEFELEDAGRILADMLNGGSIERDGITYRVGPNGILAD